MGELIHELLSLPETPFAGLARTSASHTPKSEPASCGADTSLVGSQIATVDDGSTVGTLTERDLSHDVALPHDAATVLAGSITDVRFVALGVLAH
jgi:hypothetical protein